ncbi:MAG: iron-sulfur cluster insertion protein ErpA [Acidobacteriota bacterium]
MLTLTESAVTQVREMKKTENLPDKALRVFVEAGGCSGFSYGMQFDEKREDDNVMTFGDVEVVVDPKSAQYLEGLEVDFVTSWQETGFKIKNPNAKSTCGCGHSFNV